MLDGRPMQAHHQQWLLRNSVSVQGGSEGLVVGPAIELVLAGEPEVGRPTDVVAVAIRETVGNHAAHIRQVCDVDILRKDLGKGVEVAGEVVATERHLGKARVDLRERGWDSAAELIIEDSDPLELGELAP